MPVEQMTFTVLNRGEGYNPSAAGYQIKACSPGLTDRDREHLAAICTHAGQAVYDRGKPVTAAAIERESAWWREHAEEGSAIPQDVLDEFPVFWSYDQIGEDRFALTRACYIGMCPDNKPGNFFAHCLVLAPRYLAAYGYNPLRLCRSGLFLTNDTGPSTELRTWDDLEAPLDDGTDANVLREPPYGAHLGAMLSSLTEARTGGRPTVLRIADWPQSVSLIEALLELLPPSARCRTTVCTYEIDPRWIPNLDGTRQGNMVSAHHVLALCGQDDRAWNLYENDYQSTYALYNFPEDRYSPAPEPRRFAAFSDDCLRSGPGDRLERYHDLIERLGAGEDPQAWDRLVDAVPLLAQPAHSQALPDAARALVEVAKTSDQARAALELVLPTLARPADADDHARLAELASEVARLVNRVEQGARPEQEEKVRQVVRPLACEALAAGRGQTLGALLGACGSGQWAVLLGLLKESRSDPEVTVGVSADDADRRHLVKLMIDTALNVIRDPTQGKLSQGVLVLTFQTASQAGLAADAWQCLAAEVAKPALGGDWDESKHKLAEGLLVHLTSDTCPEGNLWLNVRLIEASGPQGRKLQEALANAAAACSHCDDADEHAQRLLAVADRLLPDGYQRAVALGRMAEAASGTPLEGTFSGAYLTAVGRQENQRNNVHKRLAELGAVGILCEEMLADVLPWDEQGSPERLESWHAAVLKPFPQALTELGRKVAALLGQLQDGSSLWPLAARLLALGAEGNAEDLAPLYDAMAMSLPLAPLDDPWSKVLRAAPSTMDDAARRRLDLLKLMQNVAEGSASPEWSTTKFPHGERAWQEVRQLDPGDRRSVLDWLIRTFVPVGASVPKEAAALVRLLQQAGFDRPADVANVVTALLEGRPPLTCGLMARNFVLCAFARTDVNANWPGIVEAIVTRFDKKTRRLFEEDLVRGFWPGKDPQRRLKPFRDALGLQPPVPAELGREGVQGQPSPGGSETRSGFTGTMRHLGKIIGLGRSSRPPDDGPGGHRGERD